MNNHYDKNDQRLNTNKVYTINVGGIIHTTTLSTLCRYPDSMIARMFTGSIPPTQSIDSSGNIFLDRDGVLFGYVLNFLRSGVLTLPDSFHSFNSLQIEADFFGLDELIEALKAYRTNHKSFNNSCGSRFVGYFIEIMEFEEASSFNRFYTIGDQQNNRHWRVTPKNGGLIVSGHQDVLKSLPISYPSDNMSSDYPSVIVHSCHKMEIFHHLSSKNWELTHTGLSYGTDNEGSYIIHEYIWQKPISN